MRLKEQIKIKNNNLVITLSVPLKQKDYNPYDDSEGEEMDNIIGMVIHGETIGFSYLISRSYKGKDPDVSNPFYLYQGKEEDFRKLCKKLKIGIVEYPTCSECFESIMGACTWGDKGYLCFDCEKK